MLSIRRVRNKQHLLSQKCFYSTSNIIEVDELKLKEFGSPDTSVVHSKSDIKHTKLTKGHILVKLLAAPINPADINIIQGKYALLPHQLPALLGNEGAFEVIEANESKKGLKAGDWVLPNTLGWGSWRTYAIESEEHFVKIPTKLDRNTAATLAVNPCTAYRLLHDFVKLKPGDTVVQNGANSAVGQAVIQFAKSLDVNVINIVRKREKQSELDYYLRSLGAKHILTDEELKRPHLVEALWSEIKKPKLALNCVGGKINSDMLRIVDKDASLVTYGGMSRLPVTINTADFIFKNLKCFGFWLTSWRQHHAHASEYENMLDEICELVKKVDFKPPQFDEFKLAQYQEAFKNAQASYLDKKSLFVP